MSQDAHRDRGTELRIGWLDLLRGVALAWVFTNHLSERIFGYPLIGNPKGHWPPLSERVHQLDPLPGGGLHAIAANVIRYVGWAGDQGVSLFVIASGFAVTWTLLSKGERRSFDAAKFLRRRAERIYPEWWAAHIALMAAALLIGTGISPFDIDTWLSMAGVRLSPKQLYYAVPAWWYVGLQIQLYLVYPLLWRALDAWGPSRFLATACGVSLVVRAVGMLCFGDYLDAWSRGVIFVTRLPEFAFGIALAAWMVERPAETDQRLRRLSTLTAAAVLYAIGLVLALFLLGMAIAPFVLGLALIGLLYAPLRSLDARDGALSQALRFAGRHSYALYLVHQPCILAFVPAEAAGGALVIDTLLAALATVAAGLALERAVASVRAILRRWRQEMDPVVLLARLGALLALPLFFIFAGEWAIRRFAPQEVWGWGERPSLVSDPEMGWKLAPGKTTRLRWESYDYVVSANELGFPGPLVPAEKALGTFRILVTGDAFTSAEGVDTADAWPRQLERDLLRCATLADRFEVVNFAVTGYGPNQYAAVIRRYVPLFAPDLVLIGFFANEYDDVRMSTESFHRSIGFGLDDPAALTGWLRVPHLRRFLATWATEFLDVWVHRRPTDRDYFYGHVSALERDRQSYREVGRNLVEARLTEIADVTRASKTPVWLVVIPAPVQVCDAASLHPSLRFVDLRDTDRFDLDQPQRLTTAIAARLGLDAIDLRPLLAGSERCVYQPNNLHWTREGHSAVASFLAGEICDRGRLRDSHATPR